MATKPIKAKSLRMAFEERQAEERRLSHVAALKDILTSYGTYAILVAILEYDERILKDHHEDAVIQRDIFNLRKCVADMKGNHFIRMSSYVPISIVEPLTGTKP